MATTITVQRTTGYLNGDTNFTREAADTTMYFRNTGKEILHVVNTSGAPVNVSVETQAKDRSYNEASYKTVAVPSSGTNFVEFGPFLPSAFNDSQGRAVISFASTTNMQVAVYGWTHTNNP